MSRVRGTTSCFSRFTNERNGIQIQEGLVVVVVVGGAVSSSTATKRGLKVHKMQFIRKITRDPIFPYKKLMGASLSNNSLNAHLRRKVHA